MKLFRLRSLSALLLLSPFVIACGGAELDVSFADAEPDVIELDAGVVEIDATTTAPDSGVIFIDASVVGPDGSFIVDASTAPDTSVTPPIDASVGLDSGKSFPDSSTSIPDSSVFDAEIEASAPDSGPCTGPADCSGQTPICCASITLGPGVAPNCALGSLQTSCESSCPTSIALTCSVTDSTSLCASSGDCTDPNATSCCEFAPIPNQPICVAKSISNFAIKCF